MIKQLILVRHAHRDTTTRSMDNGLSEKGERQAKWLKRFAQSRFEQKDWQDLKGLVLTSPKLRCVETVSPLSEYLQSKIQVRPDLEEQRNGENFASLNERIQSFMSWWVKEGPPLVVACSHGDWLPLAIFHLLGVAVDMKKGAWLEIEWESGRAHLRWYVPSFKYVYGS